MELKVLWEYSGWIYVCFFVFVHVHPLTYADSIQHETLTWWEASTTGCSSFGGSLFVAHNNEYPSVSVSANDTDAYWVGGLKYSSWRWTGDNSSYYRHVGYTRNAVLPQSQRAGHNVSGNSAVKCHRLCGRNYTRFGLQRDRCFCLESIPTHDQKQKKSSKISCPGNVDECCGDEYGMSLYTTDNTSFVPDQNSECAAPNASLDYYWIGYYSVCSKLTTGTDLNKTCSDGRCIERRTEKRWIDGIPYHGQSLQNISNYEKQFQLTVTTLPLCLGWRNSGGFAWINCNTTYKSICNGTASTTTKDRMSPPTGQHLTSTASLAPSTFTPVSEGTRLKTTAVPDNVPGIQHTVSDRAIVIDSTTSVQHTVSGRAIVIDSTTSAHHRLIETQEPVKKDKNIVLYIGGAAGSAAVLLVLVLIIIWTYRKRKLCFREVPATSGKINDGFAMSQKRDDYNGIRPPSYEEHQASSHMNNTYQEYAYCNSRPNSTVETFNENNDEYDVAGAFTTNAMSTDDVYDHMHDASTNDQYQEALFHQRPSTAKTNHGDEYSHIGMNAGDQYDVACLQPEAEVCGQTGEYDHIGSLAHDGAVSPQIQREAEGVEYSQVVPKCDRVPVSHEIQSEIEGVQYSQVVPKRDRVASAQIQPVDSNAMYSQVIKPKRR